MHCIGIDLGATNVRAVLSDSDGNFLSELREETDKESPNSLIDQIVQLVERAIEGVDLKDVERIGIGSVGPLDMKKGTISPTNIHFKDIPLVDSLSTRFDLQVSLLNDCGAAALGEKWFGSAKEEKNFIYVTLSTGIGGGVYVDGRLLLGKDGNAAEIGHLTIDMDQRLRCGCGRMGHWEAYCSGANIPNFVRYYVAKKKGAKSPIVEASGSGTLTSKYLFDRAKENDPFALDIVEEMGRYNAMGFADLINAYDPALITVGGSLALNNEDLVLGPIKKHVGEHAWNRLPMIELTPLGDDAVLYGAVALALHPDEVIYEK
jgi:glucokinase